MAWVYTTRIVAGVADEDMGSCERSEVSFPHDPCDGCGPSVSVDLAIALLVSGAFPFPALVRTGFGDEAPHPFYGRHALTEFCPVGTLS